MDATRSKAHVHWYDTHVYKREDAIPAVWRPPPLPYPLCFALAARFPMDTVSLYNINLVYRVSH